MSVTKSIQFYCGSKNVIKHNLFGGTYKDYEYCKDIAYSDVHFSAVASEMREYMFLHNIRVGYCDISVDFGGGYSLLKRYMFINKSGILITSKQKYNY